MKINLDDVLKACLIGVAIVVGIVAIPVIFIVGAALLPFLLVMLLVSAPLVLIGIAIGRDHKDPPENK